MEEWTRWRSHLGERGWHARKIPTPVHRFRYSFSPLFFFLWSFRGRTMGKLVYIVTTCLVVLSSRFYFWKNWLRRRIPRRTFMGTTDRRGGLVPKHLEFWNLGTEISSLNFVTTWQDGPSWARRTVTDSSRNWVSELCDGSSTTDRHRLRNPRLSRISLNVLRDVLDYSCYNYKFSGLMLII